MADYRAKKEAALQRLKTLEQDAVRIVEKTEATKNLIAECDRQLTAQSKKEEQGKQG